MQPPPGSGPHRLEKTEVGRSVGYQRNPDQWTHNLPVGRGLYNFERIRFSYCHDGGAALQAFKAGQAGVSVETSVKAWSSGYDSPALCDGRLRQKSFPYPYPASLQGLVFNSRRPSFGDRQVRQTSSLLFDFKRTNRQLFGGRYKCLRSYFDNPEMAVRGLPGADELALLEPLRGQIPGEIFDQAYVPPVNDGSGDIRERLMQACSLFSEAGWYATDGRLLDTAGQPLRFELLLQDKDLERVLLPLQRNLARVGIDMHPRQVGAS